MTIARPRCSLAARTREEPLHATASHIAAWLMIEQPGPWGADALFESRLPAVVARDLHERARRLGVRVILLRRPAARPGPRVAYLANVGRDGGPAPILVRAAFTDPAELLEADLESLAQNRPIGLGDPVAEPIYLVCTNGRHDVCCAERGRPLFEAVERHAPERVWECSHIGGDRFAGNLVCFPQGIYLGRLEADDAPRVVAEFESGRLSLPHYRGRASRPWRVQAAEQFLRERLDLRGIDDLTVTSHRGLGDGAAEVGFGGPAGDGWVVRVRVTRSPRRDYLTCRAEREHAPLAFELVSVEPATPIRSSPAASSTRRTPRG